MKIKKLLLITMMLAITIFQVNAQKSLDPAGVPIENKTQKPSDLGSEKVDCLNNNGYSIITTGTTAFEYMAPNTTLVCNNPSAAYAGDDGKWTSFSSTGFIDYTFSPAICGATISYSWANGPTNGGVDIAQISIDAGNLDITNVCGADLSGTDVLTCNLVGTGNPIGDVTFRITSDQPFTTITLTNIGGQSGWVQGEPCNFIIEDCCTSPIVDAVLVDADGKEKDTFCYLEDIFLDASGSSNYDEYFMSVWEYDDLGNTINYSRFDPWWQTGPVPSPFNISDFPWHPSTDWMFCPGGTYAIQFALRNDCDGWESVMLDFKVECCRSSAVAADFELIIPQTNGDTYTMEAVNYELYDNSPEDCPVTHMWCVYEKDDNGDGSLTWLATIFDEDFTYTGQDGIHYTVVHRVISPCGDDCYAVEIFRDAEGLRSGAEFTSQRVECPPDCDPCPKPVVDAVLVDKEGKKKDTFCYLEDIYLDASGSSNYTEFFMSVWEYDDQGNTINYSRFDPWWMTAPVPTPFNISTFPWFPSTDWMFCPGGTYAIQFALRNECDGWESIMLDFKVECCRSNTVDADFELIIPATNGDTYTMEAVNYDTYPGTPEACPISHVWCVYEKDDNGDGSLTYITSIYGEDFTYTGQDGIHYTVVHKVKSPCGDDCYAVEIFRDAENLRSGAEFSAQRVDCPEDCDAGCIPPTGLTCNSHHGQITLSWDAVAGATGYVVEITFNDPDCCRDAGFPTSLQLEASGNSIPLEFSPAVCWSWRVLSICGDEKSEWSEKECMPAGGGCDVRRCDTPEKLYCLSVEGGIQLNWSDVSGAVSYIVELVFDDPDCCEGREPTAYRYYPTDSRVWISTPRAPCWSWKVMAVCGEGNNSLWSEKVCMREGFKCLSIFEQRNTADGSQITDEVSLRAFPNPFNDIVNFELSELKTTQYLSLTDVLGRVVLEQEIAPFTGRVQINTGTLITGIYYARLRQSDGQIMTTKIVKK